MKFPAMNKHSFIKLPYLCILSGGFLQILRYILSIDSFKECGDLIKDAVSGFFIYVLKYFFNGISKHLIDEVAEGAIGWCLMIYEIHEAEIAINYNRKKDLGFTINPWSFFLWDFSF